MGLHNPSQRVRLGARLLGSALLVASCESEPPRPERTPAPPAPPASSREPAPAASASAPAEVSSADAAARPPAGLAGRWEGTYEAKRGFLTMPPKVEDESRRKDDGKRAIGPGTVTLTIEPGGELRGSARGALGQATLSGKAEGGLVRASIFPDEPTSPDAMTGVLVGKLEGEAIAAEIRVAGPDATVIRESRIRLERKAP